MKKIFALLLIISTLTSFSACKNIEVSNNEIIENSTSSKDINKNEPGIVNDLGNTISENDTDETEKIDEVAEKPSKEELLKKAYGGKIDGIEFGIGAISGDIIDKWGEPDASDYFLGGLYLKYGDIVFFTNGYDESGKVVNISFSDENTEVYGIRLGMMIKEIEEILGTPDAVTSSKDNEESEYYFDNWTTSYVVGNYELIFAHKDKDSSIKWIDLWQK